MRNLFLIWALTFGFMASAALTKVPINSGTSGTLGDTRGGTGQSSYTAGDMISAASGTSLSKTAIGSTSQVWTVTGATTHGWATPAIQSKNYVMNADFRFFQRQAPGTVTSRADDVYGPDRWYALTEGGNVGFSQNGPTNNGIYNSPHSVILTQQDASARRYGIAQIVESENAIELRGRQVTLSMWALSNSTNVTAVRICIGEWTGTLDGVTSDVVSSWGNTPTWISNFACANTPASVTINGSSWTQVSATATLGSTFNNLVVVIWTPNQEAQNDIFYISAVQLVDGPHAVPWPRVSLPVSIDETQVQRYYQTMNYGCVGGTYSATAAVLACPFRVEMRATPTVGQFGVITVHEPSAATYTQSGTGFAASYPGTKGIAILPNNLSGMTAFRPVEWYNTGSSTSGSPNGTITLDAEL